MGIIYSAAALYMPPLLYSVLLIHLKRCFYFPRGSLWPTRLLHVYYLPVDWQSANSLLLFPAQ